MINQQLLTYIKNQQEAGTDDATIKDNLAQAGWRDEDITEGFQAVQGGDNGQNSPAAHQEIRQEAAQQRNRSAADTDESPKADPYKEPIDQEDQSDSDYDGGDNPEISSVESSLDQSTEDQVQQEDSSEESKKDPQQPVAENQNPDTTQTGTSDDTGPVRVRTYERDKKIAQGQGDDLSASSVGKKQVDPQKQVDNLSKEVAASVSSHRKSREVEQQSKQKTPEEAAFEAREKRAKESERELDESGEELAAGGGMDTVTTKRPKEASMAGRQSKEAAQESPQEPSRETDTGRQRFSRGQNAAAAKQRLQRNKKPRESGSSSNLVSILLFIAALVVVVGGAVYAYMTYYQTETPETTAAAVMQSLAASETFDFRITIQSATADDGTEETQVIEGAFDLSQETPAASYYTLTSDQSQMPLQATMAEVENQTSIPDSQLETARDILLSPQFFSIGEFQTTESLGAVGTSTGFTTNRYGVSLNPTQLVSDYATLHQAIFNTPLSQEVLSNLQATVGEFTPTRGQAWIDPDTGAPYQITLLGTNAAGGDVQINFQFKNHGVELVDNTTYEPRSIEQVLDDYFTMISTTTDSEDDDSVATSSTSTPDEVDDQSETQQINRIRKLDQLRVNDIQQIMVALRVYANDTGAFPSSLSELTGSTESILMTVPRDPQTENAYSYSVSSDGEQYHLGATLQLLQRGDLPSDANFNSRGQGFPAGFNGAAAGCQISEADPAATCYDIAGSIE